MFRIAYFPERGCVASSAVASAKAQDQPQHVRTVKGAGFFVRPAKWRLLRLIPSIGLPQDQLIGRRPVACYDSG